MTNSITVPASNIRRFLDSVLSTYNLPEAISQAIVDHLIDANRKGVDSHGLQQIIGYDKSLRQGRINPNPNLRTTVERTNLIQIDADGSPGQYAGKTAIETAIAHARKTGLAVIGVTHSNHFGMAGYYTHLAAQAGMIAFATSDTNVVDLAPYGGRSAKIGNNPIAWGIPTGTPHPIILDMAAGTVSGGKIKHFAYQGLPIPQGWGLTASGEPTDQGEDVAVNLPASYKGAGLAFISDLLCGPLLGTAAAMFKQKPIHDQANGTGHLFWVMDVEAWTDLHLFEQEVQRAISALKSTPRLDPDQPIYYPGELEGLTFERRSQSGIPIPMALIDALIEHFGGDSVNLLTTNV